ncbi:serine carboxypeptidase S28-domain-containing protein [Mycena rosella]|uniref:Serine carboxypeptidase S28-domain-containing protein n=1 Tax=Mycena rosella TaxID=1033263 RepID=A0AAD7DMN5_MYCRO|nr:serine carboxypeptidase S28-domain-containing protein [Mycena rosella]
MRSLFLSLRNVVLIPYGQVARSALSSSTSISSSAISTSTAAASIGSSRSTTTSAPAPTKTSTCSFPPEQWFDQLINHSAASDHSNFAQRVQVNNTFYKPGGPLFMFQGDDSSISCQELFEFGRRAPEFGAALMTIEHRYFGKSLPYGNSTYNTTENMRFLTLDNVISDTITVVDWWRANVTESKNAPVIVFGGSYSATLATILRINHPSTFFGAVASAGPVRGFLPVTNDPDRFNRFDLVSQYWMDHAPDAAAKVKEGFEQLQEMVDAGKSAEIAGSIAACNPPNKEERDDFLRGMASLFGLMLEANMQYVGPTFNITGFPWDVVANRTLAASSPLAAVNETINTYCHVEIAKNGCFDWTTLCAESIGAQAFPWAYLRCSYLNFDTGDAAPGTIFAATNPYESKAYCQQTFNLTPPTRTELFAKYHFDEATIRNTTRVSYSQGGVDPVRGLAPDQSWFEVAPTDPNAPRYVYADYATHTQDLLSSLIPGNDDPSLLRVRDQEKNIIKGWLRALNGTGY